MRLASLHCFPLSPPPVIAALPFHTLLLECRTTSRGGREGRQFACSRRRRLPHPLPSLPRSRYHHPPPLQGHCFDPAHSMLGPLDRASSAPLLFPARRILSSFWARGVNVAYPVSPSSIICRRGRRERSWDTGYPRYPQLPFPSPRSSSSISRSVTVPLAHRPSLGEEASAARLSSSLSANISTGWKMAF